MYKRLFIITNNLGVTMSILGLRKENELTDYSYLTEDKFKPNRYGGMAHCISGLGPFSHRHGNMFLGGWYFHGKKLKTVRRCYGAFLQYSESAALYPGVVSLRRCGPLSPDEEGIYSCMMKNSSMMVETQGIGLYLTGRSE